MAVSVVLTPAARDAVARVRRERGDDLALVIGNGCCDSTAPYLFAHHLRGPNERPVGEVEGLPVLLDAALTPLFEDREVVIDAAPASPAGEDSFSCEAELGLRLSLDRLPAHGLQLGGGGPRAPQASS